MQKAILALGLLAGLVSSNPTTYPTMDKSLYKRAPGMVFNCDKMPGMACMRDPTTSSPPSLSQADRICPS